MLKQIREHYKIPQSLFAGYLGISRSQLSMAESGRRNISAESLANLLPLYLAISSPASKSKERKPVKETAQLKVEWIAFLEKKKTGNEFKLRQLENQLVKLKAEQARCSQILQNMPSFRAASKQREILLLDIIEMSAAKRQMLNSPTARLKLELKILALKAESAYLHKLPLEPDAG
jgi:transcriptional regulator with XRE-family HTH domain